MFKLPLLLLALLLQLDMAVADETRRAPLAAPDSACVGSGDYKRLTYLLIDRSDSMKDSQELKELTAEVKKAIRRGDRLIVGVGTGKAGGLRILFDLVRPIKTIWEPPVRVHKSEENFERCFESMVALAASREAVHRGAALLESLSDAAVLLYASGVEHKRLIVYSDMVQDTEQSSFYMLKKVDPNVAFEKARGAELIPDLNGTAVEIIGAGKNVTDEKAADIERFWNLYFSAAKANLTSYTSAKHPG